MSTGILLILRLTHVVLGVFWVGAVAFIAFFLVPSVRAAGPAGGAVMQQLIQARRMAGWLTAAGILTLLSGILLYWHDSAGFGSAEWMRSGPGRTFGLGAVLAIVATIVGMAVNVPAARGLGALMGRLQAAGRPPSPDELAIVQELQARLARGALIAAVLLLLAAAAMAVARYT